MPSVAIAPALLIHGGETPVSLSLGLALLSLLMRSPPVGPRGYQETTFFTGYRGEKERERKLY
jgi:hypothetical protein